MISRGGVSLAELSRRLDIMAGNGHPSERMIACARADGLLTHREADALLTLSCEDLLDAIDLALEGP